MTFAPKRHFPDFSAEDREAWPEIIEAIEAAARPAAELVVVDEHPGLNESRLGGCPSWPEGLDLPADGKGNRLVFLAQINCEDLGLPGFPNQGMLQFFVGGFDLWGCDFPSVSVNGTAPGFRVIFHEDPEALRHCPTYYAGYSPNDFDHPFVGENWMVNSFTFVPRTALMSPHSCKAGDDLLDELLAQFSEDDDPGAIMDYDWPEANVGGFPNYTQTDIAYDVPNGQFDTVLLSLGSIPRILSVGDSGRFNFLIREEDLANRDFSRVAYTWDCC